MLIFVGCNVSFTTANLTKATMSSGESGGSPIDEVTTYSPQADMLYAFAVLNNAPDDTTVRFVWNYDTDNMQIYEVEMASDGQSGIYVYSTLTFDGLWPTGDYSVDFYIDDREQPDQTVKFTIQ